MAEFHGRGERQFPSVRGAAHDADQTRPINLRGTLEATRPCIAQSPELLREKNVTGLIQTTPPSASKHLQQLICLDMPLEISRHVARIGHEYRPHRKINARGEAHCSD